jgi:cobalt transporter subunit CbtB
MNPAVGGTEKETRPMTTLTSHPALSRTSARVLPALAALILGLSLFLATGFAWPSAVHNATHDARHSLGLPCH